MLNIVILGLGGLLGFGYGYQTRPSFLGVKVPLEIMTSNSPMDATFRSDLIAHLTISTAIGLGGALAVVMIVAALKNASGEKV